MSENQQRERHGRSIGPTRRVETRSVQDTGGSRGTVLAANLTAYGRKYHDIEKGDTVVVRICDDGILIEPDPESVPEAIVGDDR